MGDLNNHNSNLDGGRRPRGSLIRCLKDGDNDDIGLVELAATSAVSASIAKKDSLKQGELSDCTDGAVTDTEGNASLQNETAYPRRVTLVLMTVALMMSVFIVALDSNIIGQYCREMTLDPHPSLCMLLMG